MSGKTPPVPPENLSHKGPGEPQGSHPDMGSGRSAKAPQNLAEQDRQGNIRQNTTHQGF